MKTSRRTFLKTGAVALAATAILPESVFAAKKRKVIIGYKYVEHANYTNRKFYGYAPAEFKKVLDGQGLKIISMSALS
jgi:hypothetical protein